ncbi:MAG: CARDB domain-containing protein, partial [Thermoplasmatota archaeon]
MRKHRVWPVPILALLAVSMMLVPALITTAASDRLYGAPDLAVTELTIVPARDSFEGALKIRNLGLSSSVTVDVIVMDVGGSSLQNRSVVVTFPLLPLGPNKEFVKEFKWVPELPGTHIITAVVDTEGVERERMERNNAHSIMASLPFIGSISSGSDGDMDPEVLGEYFSGVENRIELDINFEGAGDPSLLRVYATVEGKFLEYGTRTEGSRFRASFDAGSLAPGNHTLVVNSTYCGFPLPQRTLTIRMRSPPPWFHDLSRGHSYFDKALSSYIFTGKADIKPIEVPTTSDKVEDPGVLLIFTEENEVYLSGSVLLDGTATISGRTDMTITGTTDGSYRHSIALEGKTFLASSAAPFTLEMEGGSFMEMDLSVLVLGRKMTATGVFGEEIVLPVPSMKIGGTSRATTVLDVGPDGRIGTPESDIALELKGNTTDILSTGIEGYDDPRFIISLDAGLSGHFASAGGATSGSNELALASELLINDLGLEAGDAVDGWTLNPQGVGTDIAVSPEGGTGYLELTVKEGHTTHLIYRNGTGESEVYRNNTYKSHPRLEYLKDGRPVVVWSETGYMEDPAERASSMRLHYEIPDENGSFSADPVRITRTETSEQYPVLASDHDHGRLALAFTRDLDNDIRTLQDREVMVTFYVDESWTDPESVTDDEIVDREPDLWFDEDGGLHLVWLSHGGNIRYSSWNEVSGWSPPIVVDIDADLIAEDVSIAGDESGEPVLLATLSSPGNPHILSILDPVSTPAILGNITASMGHIGSSSLVRTRAGSYDAMWREWTSTGGDLYCSTTFGPTSSGPWTKPLRITSDGKMELSPSMSRIGASDFLLGYMEVVETEGNVSLPQSPTFSIRNLSWGGEVVSFSVSDPSATPGTMVISDAMVEYR